MLPLVYRTDGSGGSRGGAQAPPPPSPSLCLDQTEARRAKKILGERAPPYLSIWMTAPPPPPSPIWRSGSATGRYGIGSLFAMGGKLWASLRSIPSWKSNLCCMLHTNVHWFVCLFVCLFLEDKKKNKHNDICSWVKWLVSNYQNLYLPPTLRGIKQNKWSINT